MHFSLVASVSGVEPRATECPLATSSAEARRISCRMFKVLFKLICQRRCGTASMITRIDDLSLAETKL